jgi:hypothetical protein
VELRRTDWYRVRAEGGQVGWVQRRQLEATLTAAGAPKTFRDVLLDDYLTRRAGDGRRLGPLQGRAHAQAVAALPAGRHPGRRAHAGQVQGVFSGTDFWACQPDQRALVRPPPVALPSPSAWASSATSPTAAWWTPPTNANLAHATLGLRWHLSERFTARLDWTLYTAFVADQRSTEYRAFTAGLAFFF